ncbi:MAG: hypothetical protein ACK4ZR_02190 [Aquificaceae bacterium]
MLRAKAQNTKKVKLFGIGIYVVLIFLFVFSKNAFCVEVKNVKNFKYYLSFPERKFALKNGIVRIYNPPNDIAEVCLEKYKLVDLNNDGVKDAIVILVGTYGGSGAFYELTVLLSKGKNIVQTNSVVLGDRIIIKKIFTDFRVIYPYIQIGIHALTHRDSDAMASPTKRDVICYALVKEKLIPCENKPTVKTPALYLYPEKEQTIRVKLSPKGYIKNSIPPYKNRWIVRVAPTGEVNNKYNHLSYEVKLKKPYILTDTGWVVPYNDLSKWFDSYLPKLGLNKKEVEDFKNYWLKKLKPYDYYEIRYIEEEFLKENMHIDIDPKPDTFIRVFLHFEGMYFKRNLIEPHIPQKTRKGFVVVEWGGIMAKSE